MSAVARQFLEQLVSSDLVTRAELSLALGNDLSLADESEALIESLVAARIVTPFQAERLKQGDDSLMLGEYILLDRIGAGGMGEVFLAEHRRMRRKVALKMLPADAMASDLAIKRFRVEVQAAAQLDHPNIVTAYDAGEHDGAHFLVMQFVDGRNLAEVVRDDGPLSVARAVDCIVQTAKGLRYAHVHGVIHRDIKPSNLLLDRSGVVKILDMGLARLTRPDRSCHGDESRLTASDQVMGTMDYMAPEQAEDTRQADERSDIYSLGCTMYRLLCGVPPYQGDTAVRKIIAHREASIPSIRKLRHEVPKSVDRLFRAMVAKAPEDRPASMDAVIDALEPLMSENPNTCWNDLFSGDGEPFTNTATKPLVDTDSLRSADATVAKASSVKKEQIRRRYVLPLGLTALLLVVAVIAGAAAWLNRDGDEKERVAQAEEERVAPELSPNRDGWIDLLAGEPQELFWPAEEQDGRWELRKEQMRPELFASCRQYGLLGLGSVDAKDFEFRIEVSQTPWSGSIGFIYGYPKEEAAGANDRKYEVLRIERRQQHANQVDYRLIREVRVQAPTDNPVFKGTQNVGTYQLPMFAAGEAATFRVVVREGVLQELYCNEQRLKDIFDRPTIGEDNALATGRLGIFIDGASCTVQSAELSLSQERSSE